MAEKVPDLAALKAAQDGDYIERVVRGKLQRLTRTGVDSEGNLITASEAIAAPLVVKGTLPPELAQIAAETLIYIFDDPNPSDLAKKSRPYWRFGGQFHPNLMPTDITGEVYDVAELIVSDNPPPAFDPAAPPTWGMWVRNRGKFEIYFWATFEESGVETRTLIQVPLSYELTSDGALQANDSLNLSQT